MAVIEISQLTKDYGHGRGVFDVSIRVDRGECYGFLGPNGAGKTTTIRHLMGFSKPQSGFARIDSADCWHRASELKNKVGYLPGELALPQDMTGEGFLRMAARLHGLEDLGRARELAELFELDAASGIKRMSLGTKRKLALVSAFLHDPEILILDEPSSGLDPVMQQKFIELILWEKERGRTIFLSSHIFHEVDAACDRIGIIKDGQIVSEFQKDELREKSAKLYRVTFPSAEALLRFVERFPPVSREDGKNRASFSVPDEKLDAFLFLLAESELKDFEELPITLENYFMQFYRGEEGTP